MKHVEKSVRLEVSETMREVGETINVGETNIQMLVRQNCNVGETNKNFETPLSVLF